MSLTPVSRAARVATVYAVIIWAAAALFLMIGHYADNGKIGWPPILVALSGGMLGVLGSVILFTVAARQSRQPAARRLPVVLVAAMFVGAGVALSDAAFGTYVVAPLVPMHPNVWLWAIGSYPIMASLCVACATLFDVLVQQDRLTAQERETAEAQLNASNALAAAERARLQALRWQLNPHFLFNTLNAISVNVMAGRGSIAERMLEKLADFLRASLDADAGELSTLEAEFEILEAYLDIESVRFGDRLQVELVCPASLRAAPLPGFLLQPLVENAVKYGVGPSVGPVTVRIEAQRTGDGDLRLIVSDTGDGSAASAPSAGVGLANVRQRLALQYGAGARLEATATSGGFRAELHLPWDSQ
ncbi:sensor histidine kinase [Brevundimonas sp.]|uniref:sensor histidine kinase n=1 Tax=Brevundimonas sp. TaxID=1871086 RepID=UPI001848FB7E|nr:histidine kinase [Brevundimonas sp.]MBA3050416.1 histidine kinase [Brevundimonas sp.]